MASKPVSGSAFQENFTQLITNREAGQGLVAARS
jgi:hypothetical protein